MSTQLPLGIQLQDPVSFDNFLPGQNQTTYEFVQHLIDGQGQGETSVFLYGISGTGKTHLLQAACQRLTQRGSSSAYLPLTQFKQFSTEMLDGLEHLELVCIDDIQEIAQITRWETALFHLFNRLRDNSIPLLITASARPDALGFTLHDLVSRLFWGGIFELQPLDDAAKVKILQQHAQNIGITLPQDVAIYLLQHCSRDLQTLMQWLQQLDYISLAQRKKITLPLVRHLLAHSK
jgi:DnaA-homolog protein